MSTQNRHRAGALLGAALLLTGVAIPADAAARRQAATVARHQPREHLTRSRGVRRSPRRTHRCRSISRRASDGMQITVSCVDRTIRSVNDHSNRLSPTADPYFRHGVGILVKGTNRNGSDPTPFAPATDFQLRLGTGVLVQAYASSASTVRGASGINWVCHDPSFSEELTRGGSYGPLSICFSAPNTAALRHLTLYYMPDGADVLVKIPLQ